MPPTPKTATVMQQQNLHSRIFPSTLDDEIVVSGISGKFPNSKNIAEFESNLYNKVRSGSSNQLIKIHGPQSILCHVDVVGSKCLNGFW